MAEENNNGDLQGINEQLYKQNLELAVRNKILSLLRELYQISILTLEPIPLAEKVSILVQKAVELELVIIYAYSRPEDNLTPLACAKSNKLEEILKRSLGRYLFASPIEKVSVHPDFRKVLNRETVVVSGIMNLCKSRLAAFLLPIFLTLCLCYNMAIEKFLVYSYCGNGGRFGQFHQCHLGQTG